MVVNKGDVTSKGYELEAQSVPLYNLSLKGGYSYTHLKSADSAPTGRDLYACRLALTYDDRDSLQAQLAGNYTWWSLPAEQGARYSTFVWDLNLAKRFPFTPTTSAELFFIVHNLFGGAYYTLNLQPNPSRWVEGGLRLRF